MYSPATFIALLGLLITIACGPADQQDLKDFADDLHAAQTAREVPPQASGVLVDMTVDKAYRVQKALVDRHLAEKEIFGFKAGLTTPAAQQRFNVEQPVAGVLFSGGRRRSGDTVFLADYNRMTVETELGFYVKEEIEEPIQSITELKGQVQFILPVLEFPNAAFGEAPEVYDIISANAGSAFYVVGPKTEIGELDVNAQAVQLHKETTLMNSGRGADAMGDQWETLRWLINRMIAQGYVIRPDHLLITGALGNAFPAEAGAYVADYGNLGSVDFYIK